MSVYLQEEKGAVTIVVAAFMVAAFALAALVVDVGSLYEERRQLQTAADSAALAAARDLALDPTDEAGAIATGQYFAYQNPSNNPAAGSVIVTPDVLNNRVSVTINETVTPESGGLFFAPALGMFSTDVPAHATATWNTLSAAIGAIPLTIKNDHEELLDFKNGVDDEAVLVFDFQAIQDPSGNWGWLDFIDGGGTAGAAQLRKWILGLEEVLVDLGWTESTPGLNTNDATNTINKRTEIELVMPVFSCTNELPGANLEYYITGFVGVVIHDAYKGNKDDDPETKANDFILDVTFTRMLAQGELGEEAEDYGVYGIKLDE